MYEWNEEEKKIDFSHNPFSMPQGGLEALEAAKSTRSCSRSRPTSTTSSATASRWPRAAFATTSRRPWSRRSASPGSGRRWWRQRFGGMYRAFQYGAPPHGGMAAGIDRMVMLLVGAKNLREVALFPMNQQANDLLMGAPQRGVAKAAARAAHPDRPPER